MKILIVSGFLGAGKTSFIKELIKKTGKKLVIMENEFGETDLDSRELKKVGELEILEFMEGCVCCTMKDSFVKSVLAVSQSLDPEYLIIEPTGVGKLGSILESLEKICYEKIILLKPLLILPPRSFLSNISSFSDIYIDQIKNASIILFSKAENEDSESLEQIKKKISEINPAASIISEHYSKFDSDWFNSLLMSENEQTAINEDIEAKKIDEICFRGARLSCPAELICLIEDILRNEFGRIARAKGVLPIGNEKFRYDLADGLYGIIKESDSSAKTQCVFIGENIDKSALCLRLNSSEALEEHLRPEHICSEGCSHHHGHGKEHHHYHCHEHEAHH